MATDPTDVNGQENSHSSSTSGRHPSIAAEKVEPRTYTTTYVLRTQITVLNYFMGKYVRILLFT